MNLETPPDVARQMMCGIMRIRMIEERIRTLYAEQEMRCPTHFSIGQEAVAVGVCAHLKREELITSAHRSRVAFAKCRRIGRFDEARFELTRWRCVLDQIACCASRFFARSARNHAKPNADALSGGEDRRRQSSHLLRRLGHQHPA